MQYVNFLLSLRDVENLLHERGLDISMNAFGTGGIGLAINLHTRSKSVGQGNVIQTLKAALAEW